MFGGGAGWLSCEVFFHATAHRIARASTATTDVIGQSHRRHPRNLRFFSHGVPWLTDGPAVRIGGIKRRSACCITYGMKHPPFAESPSRKTRHPAATASSGMAVGGGGTPIVRAPGLGFHGRVNETEKCRRNRMRPCAASGEPHARSLPGGTFVRSFVRCLETSRGAFSSGARFNPGDPGRAGREATIAQCCLCQRSRRRRNATAAARPTDSAALGSRRVLIRFRRSPDECQHAWSLSLLLPPPPLGAAAAVSCELLTAAKISASHRDTRVDSQHRERYDRENCCPQAHIRCRVTPQRAT
jgi:hypothetical protein